MRVLAVLTCEEPRYLKSCAWMPIKVVIFAQTDNGFGPRIKLMPNVSGLLWVDLCQIQHYQLEFYQNPT